MIDSIEHEVYRKQCLWYYQIGLVNHILFGYCWIWVAREFVLKDYNNLNYSQLWYLLFYIGRWLMIMTLNTKKSLIACAKHVWWCYYYCYLEKLKKYDKNQCDVLKIFYREKKILVKVEEISPRVQKQKRAWLQDPPTIMHI